MSDSVDGYGVTFADSDGHHHFAVGARDSFAFFYSRTAAAQFRDELKKHAGRKWRVRPVRLTIELRGGKSQAAGDDQRLEAAATSPAGKEVPRQTARR